MVGGEDSCTVTGGSMQLRLKVARRYGGDRFRKVTKGRSICCVLASFIQMELLPMVKALVSHPVFLPSLVFLPVLEARLGSSLSSW